MSPAVKRVLKKGTKRRREQEINLKHKIGKAM
jgi:hypothetical protein